MIRALIIALVAVVIAGPVAAHTRSQSASDWHMEGPALHVSFSIDARRATLLYGLEGSESADLAAALSAHLERTIGVTQDGVPCPMTDGPSPLPAAEGYLRSGLAFNCAQSIDSGGADITIGAFFELSASHLHIIRVRQDDELVLERVLTGVDNQIQLGESGLHQDAGDAFVSFIRTGWGHVLSGWDHLAFLAALLLLAGRVRPIIVTITGFTLGHSLTMTLVALGALRPYGIAVEVLIGFSIAYAAMEAGARDMTGRQRPILWAGVAIAGTALAVGALQLGQGWPAVLAVLGVCWFVLSQSPPKKSQSKGWSWRAPALATLFGLAHGAGFAGALLEYDLSGAGMIWSLFGFNLGVELGQLCAIFAILMAFAALQRIAALNMASYRLPLAAGLFGLGVFWTVSRLALVG